MLFLIGFCHVSFTVNVELMIMIPRLVDLTDSQFLHCWLGVLPERLWFIDFRTPWCAAVVTNNRLLLSKTSTKP